MALIPFNANYNTVIGFRTLPAVCSEVNHFLTNWGERVEKQMNTHLEKHLCFHSYICVCVCV